MLTRAADKLSLKLAGAEAKEEGLLLANKEAQARMEAAEVSEGKMGTLQSFFGNGAAVCCCVQAEE